MIVATPARVTLMGNRGCLHDDHDYPVRQFQGRRWIICVLDYKARTRRPMPPGHYTSLFFLDEATALAAGHRPCAECQRERFSAFRAHWAAANPGLAANAAPPVDVIDSVLHSERISGQHFHRDKVKLTFTAQLETLPDGAFVIPATGGGPHLVFGDALYAWSFNAYGQPIARADARVQLLTPRSTVGALADGYAARIHPSARVRR